MPDSPPIALSIAGSDCSSGAGIQADLKSFSAAGVFGLTAVTCVVAEVPGKVGSIVPVPPEVLHEQLDLLRGAFPIAAIKTGMLAAEQAVEAIRAGRSYDELDSYEQAVKDSWVWTDLARVRNEGFAILFGLLMAGSLLYMAWSFAPWRTGTTVTPSELLKLVS